MFTSFVVHAVVSLTLGLIAHVVVVVFVVAILHRISCIWRYTLTSFVVLGFSFEVLGFRFEVSVLRF